MKMENKNHVDHVMGIEGHPVDLLKKVVNQIAENHADQDYTAIDELFKRTPSKELKSFLSESHFEKKNYEVRVALLHGFTVEAYSPEEARKEVEQVIWDDNFKATHNQHHDCIIDIEEVE